MSGQASSNVPQIRFKGFEVAWNFKKVKDLTETGFTNGVFNDPSKVGRGYRLINVTDMFSGSSIDVDNLSLIDIDESEFKKNKVRYGDIFFTRSSLVKEGIACSNVNLSDSQNLTFDGHLIRMQPYKKTTDPVFLSYAFKTSSSRRQFILGGKTTTMTTIGQSDIAAVEVALPSLTEQTQIGIHFQELDSLIDLHQRKHDKLLMLKKAMLQKMFPQAGAATPEVRFGGFSGDWLERKVAELGEVVTGSTPSTLNQKFYNENGIPWVTPTDINNNITFKVAKHISIEGEKVSRVVPMNTVLVTCIASIGKNTLLGTRGSFNQQINGLVPFTQNFDPYYLFVSSILWSQKMKMTAAAGTMQIVNKSEFSDLKTFTPSLSEQKKIGSYFRTLDALIAKHAIQLQKLKQIKSACLEKMFV
jgi:type I restriction enzyme, S subunit